jgi:hypothetical protein
MVLRNAMPSLQPRSLAGLLAVHLSQAAQTTLRQLLHSVKPPIDACRIADVISAAHLCLQAYRTELLQPGKALDEMASAIQLLDEETRNVVSAMDWPIELEYPLFRHLRAVPAWALLLDTGKVKVSPEILAGIGAELVLSLVLRKPFTKSLASLLKSALGVEQPDEPNAVWRKKLTVTRRSADRFFAVHSSGGKGTCGATAEAFGFALARQFRARIEFAREKDHQCVNDHRDQTPNQIKASARQLRQRVEAGDEQAILICAAAYAGIPPQMAIDLPLMGPWLSDWTMALDLGEGTLKTSMDLLAKGRAKARANGQTLLPSGDMIVKPMPEFLAEQFRKKWESQSLARTVGELLPTEQGCASSLVLTDDDGRNVGLKPTVARLVNGIGKFAVGIGIDRYRAAMLLNDPRLVPTGKFYYARATRDEIWESAVDLFDALGWGGPVAIVDGLAVGSKVTPSDEAVAQWGRWIDAEVDRLRPGKRYTLTGLVAFHNVVALASASKLSFLLVLRAGNPVHLQACDVAGERTSASLADKNVGLSPGRHCAPLVPLAKKQLRSWIAHCAEMERRFRKLGVSPKSRTNLRLRAVVDGLAVPLFFTINSRNAPCSISTEVLVKWWPVELGLEGNFGRHFWQNAMRAEGVSSTDIDALVRHFASGSDPFGSAGIKVQAAWSERVIMTMTTVLDRLALLATRGL